MYIHVYITLGNRCKKGSITHDADSHWKAGCRVLMMTRTRTFIIALITKKWTHYEKDGDLIRQGSHFLADIYFFLFLYFKLCFFLFFILFKSCMFFFCAFIYENSMVHTICCHVGVSKCY